MRTHRRWVPFIKCVFLVTLLIFLSPLRSSAAPSSLTIRRAWLEQGEKLLTVFLDCMENGKSSRLSYVDLRKFSAKLDGEPLKLGSVEIYDGNTAFVFLIDVSPSLEPAMFSLMKKSVEEWIREQMDRGDQAVIMTVGSKSSSNPQNFTSDRNQLLSELKRISQEKQEKRAKKEAKKGAKKEAEKSVSPALPLNTPLYKSIFNALATAGRDDAGLPRRRAVIVCTSGVNRGSYDAEALREEGIRRYPVPVYSFLVPYKGPAFNEGASNPNSLRSQFNALSRESGGWLEEVNGAKESDLNEALKELFARFRNVVEAKLDVSGLALEADGKSSMRLDMTWSDGTVMSNAVKDISFRKRPSPPRTSPAVPQASIQPESLILSHTSVELTEGKELQLTATVLPPESSEKNLIWSSSNPSIAAVDANGQVTAITRGEVKITATLKNGKLSAVCFLTVVPVSLKTGSGSRLLYISLIVAAVLSLAGGGIFVWTRKKRGSQSPAEPLEAVAPIVEAGDLPASPGYAKPNFEADVETPMNRASVPPVPSPAPQPPSRGEIVFTSIEDASHKRIYRQKFRGTLTLGRVSGPGMLMIEGDDSISRKHCEIFEASGQYMIRDLGSTNGTLVDGAPVSGHFPLNDGSVLLLGKTELRVTLPRAFFAGEPFTQRKKI